ncbi:putative g-protein coupled receptor [Golovinomyces cichoracearum]|uniref:Putative g-protein coupled receptor n=1 Tax=Golovinomyces cichoracearum TaxID=62708 RepID=A0A420IAP9_9PEZI|nr:putative g-protein coupled receptor [Golovinomyces cichoracearum]
MNSIYALSSLNNSTRLNVSVEKNYANLSIIERIGSVLSLAGTIFIVVTFLSSTSFHKPINRLVFYAAIGNIASNIATLIARSAVDRGQFNGALCQAQAFLIQMQVIFVDNTRSFMPADVLWAFAMSLNVYFTFYWHYNAADLRGLEFYYILVCYGLPFIPALTFLFISTAEKGRVYGDAILWCWIAPGWDIFRIATFYGIVWVVILVSLSIYIRAGKDIWIKRQQLRNNCASPPNPILIMKDPFGSEPIGQVMVSHTIETRSEHFIGSCDVEYPRSSASDALRQASTDYRIEISANPKNREPSSYVPMEDFQSTPVRRYAAMEANRAIWSYTKVSALFFVAMMITWIPSSANRVYSLMYNGQDNFALHFVSAFVLPLQGLWNAIIYSTTSFEACRYDWNRLRKGEPLRSGFHAFIHGRSNIFSRASKNPYFQETDSVSKLPSTV